MSAMSAVSRSFGSQHRTNSIYTTKQGVFDSVFVRSNGVFVRLQADIADNGGHRYVRYDVYQYVVQNFQVMTLALLKPRQPVAVRLPSGCRWLLPSRSGCTELSDWAFVFPWWRV